MHEGVEWWDTRTLIPNYRDIMVGKDGWKSSAAKYREEHPPEVLQYGDGMRHTMDLFHSEHGGSPLLFIHGGFWHAPLDKSFFSHMAGGPNALGVPVAVMSYDLCPTVTIDEILEQTGLAAKRLIERLGQPIIVSGHSAGGHAVAHLLRESGVKAGYALSPVSDLRPLVGVPMNEHLRLDPAAAYRLSPVFWDPPKEKPLEVVVGELEHEGFKKQARDLKEAWSRKGALVSSSELQGAHHLSVIAGLADPNSLTSQRIVEMAMQN